MNPKGKFSRKQTRKHGFNKSYKMTEDLYVLMNGGDDIIGQSTILGHSDISITLNTYVHPSLDDKMNAVKKLKF